MKPPSGGPITGPISAGTVSQASALTKPALGVVRSTISRPTGTIIEPPMPCTTRDTTSQGRPFDAPQAIEPAAKMTIASRKMVRAPNRSAIQPEAGMKIASASR